MSKYTWEDMHICKTCHFADENPDICNAFREPKTKPCKMNDWADTCGKWIPETKWERMLKVECINTGGHPMLTEGKVYRAGGYGTPDYNIIDDNADMKSYEHSLFLVLVEDDNAEDYCRGNGINYRRA